MLKIAKLYLIIFMTLAATSTCLIAHRTCYTPDYKKGECINVNDCEPISNILNNTRRNRKENLFLRDSACGFVNRTLQVCCEKSETVPDCTTPDKKPGVCVSLYECPSIYNKFKSSPNRIEMLNLSRFQCKNKYSFEFCCTDDKFFAKSSKTNLLPTRTECGRENQRLKFQDIADGQTNVRQYPWMVRVELVQMDTSSSQRQIGILINSRYVLTAAHYYAYKQLLPLDVILEKYNTKDNKDCDGNVCDEDVTKIPIEKIIVHPDFDEEKSKMDIALIRMSKSVEYTDSVRPICLPQMNILESTDSISEALVSGWSFDTNFSKTLTDNKFQIKIPIVKNDECNKIYKSKAHRTNFVTSEKFCAGRIVINNSTCHGSSTAPLMKPKNDQFELIGIDLLGVTSCNIREIPDIYLNIFLFIDWIKANMEP